VDPGGKGISSRINSFLPSTTADPNTGFPNVHPSSGGPGTLAAAIGQGPVPPRLLELLRGGAGPGPLPPSPHCPRMRDSPLCPFDCDHCRSQKKTLFVFVCDVFGHPLINRTPVRYYRVVVSNPGGCALIWILPTVIVAYFL